MNNKSIRQKAIKVSGVIALTLTCGLTEAQTINWAPAGAIYTAGRTRNMIVDKADPSGNTLLVGSVGGIFISGNGGTSWQPLDDQGTVRSISYLTQASNKT